MAIRTVGGILRALGKEQAVEFLRGYINDRVHEGMDFDAISNELERTFYGPNGRRDGWTCVAAVRAFNQMRSNGAI